MVTVTDTAKDLLQSIDHPDGTVLRLEPVGENQVGLVAGEPIESDQVVERDGADVLHVPAPVANALDGATIDSVDTEAGPRLSITAP